MRCPYAAFSRAMACEIGVDKEMFEEEEMFILPNTSQMTSPLCSRVSRGVGLAGVQERDLSSFAATSASRVAPKPSSRSPRQRLVAHLSYKPPNL